MYPYTATVYSVKVMLICEVTHMYFAMHWRVLHRQWNTKNQRDNKSEIALLVQNTLVSEAEEKVCEYVRTSRSNVWHQLEKNGGGFCKKQSV